MTVDDSKALTKGTSVFWRGDATNSGVVTETSWDAVTIAWSNGEVARVHQGVFYAREAEPSGAFGKSVSLAQGNCKLNHLENLESREH
jgi:hypothetical protein